MLDHRQPDLTVVTDFVQKQRNLAAIVRSCDSVGIMRVHAVIGDEDYRTYRGTAACRSGSSSSRGASPPAKIDLTCSPERSSTWVELTR